VATGVHRLAERELVDRRDLVDDLPSAENLRVGDESPTAEELTQN